MATVGLFLGASTVLACEAEIPSDVDVNSEEFEQVITNDAFCCNVEWDNICQNHYDDLTLGANCVDPGNGVDVNSAAYQTVISNDPFCCNNQWDNICQNAYNNAGGNTGGGDDYGDGNEEGECVTPGNAVDVESEAYQIVIENDAFCCNVQWDNICQNAYNNANGDTGDGGNWGGGNNDGECATPPAGVDVESDAYENVIANDSFCCNVQWDNICQNAYDSYLAPGECVTPNNNVDIESEAYAYVIANDSYCCDIQWDNICQNYYDDFLGPDECVAPYESVDIESEAYNTVILNDAFCCNVQWDNICQNAYNNLTGGDDEDEEEEIEDEDEEEDENEEEESECSASVPNSVDVNSEAYAYVIANDTFCCNVQWDAICNNAYNNYLAPDECVEAGPNVDTNSEAYAQVIESDWYCCEIAWDSICQNMYDDFFQEEDGDCSANIPNSVDTESEAFELVIANDPFCCNTTWDSICQNMYDDLTGNEEEEDEEESSDDCAADIPNDIDVNSEAFANVIANDSFCCDVQWDNICQYAYDSDLPDGDCVAPDYYNVDVESEAYASVIAEYSFCCEVQWDNFCQYYYEDYLGNDECVEAPEIIDTSSALYEMVIANDPFCCNNQWDSICNNAYNNQAVLGCTDEEASNYNANANLEDGSCEYGEGINTAPTTDESVLSNLDISVFPNPTNGIVQVVFNGFSVEDAYMIRVHSAIGQVVYEENVPSDAITYRTEIDLSFAASGVYIVTAFSEHEVISKRLVKQN